MPGKAKSTKHSSSWIASKIADATQNRGGGAAGAADRKGGSAVRSLKL